MEPDRTCDACGRTFTPARADARYCSGACRARASRERKRDEAAGVPGTAVERPDVTAPAKTVTPEPSPTGLRADLAERFFDVEDRVTEIGDDIEALKGLEARITELGGRVERALTEARRRAGPDEATIRTWGREAAHAEVVALTRKVQAVEGRPTQGREDGRLRADLTDLEQRVAAVEARPIGRRAPPAQDPSTKARMDEIERACIRLGRRLGTVEADLNKIALAFAEHVYGEAGGVDEDEEGEEE